MNLQWDLMWRVNAMWCAMAHIGYQYLSVARGWCPFVGWPPTLIQFDVMIICLISRSEEGVSPRNHIASWLLMHVQPFTAFELLITQPRHVLCPGQGAKQMWSQRHTAAMSEPRSLPRNIREITVAEKWWDDQKLFTVETASMLIGSVQIKSDRLWHVLQGCFLTIFQSLGNRHQSLKARRWVPLSQPRLCMPVCTTCIPVILGKHMGNIWGTTATVGQA